MRNIANAAARLNNESSVTALLEKTFQVAKKEGVSSVLKDIAILYAQRNQWNKALQVSKYSKKEDRTADMINILTIWAENQTPTLINGVVVLEAAVTGHDGNYTFTVKIQSLDRDCHYYTD